MVHLLPEGTECGHLSNPTALEHGGPLRRIGHHGQFGMFRTRGNRGWGVRDSIGPGPRCREQRTSRVACGQQVFSGCGRGALRTRGHLHPIEVPREFDGTGPCDVGHQPGSIWGNGQGGALHARPEQCEESIVIFERNLDEGVGGIHQPEIGMDIGLPSEEALAFDWNRSQPNGALTEVGCGPSGPEIPHAVHLNLAGKRR